MALKIGDTAPNFSGLATDGKLIDFDKLRATNGAVVFFFPKAYTKVCTAEVCSFKDQFSTFRDLDVPVLGISRDQIIKLNAFKQDYNLPFPLISDKSGDICKKFKAIIPIIGLPKRITYVIDKEGKVVSVLSDMFNADTHIKSALEQLKQ